MQVKASEKIISFRFVSLILWKFYLILFEKRKIELKKSESGKLNDYSFVSIKKRDKFDCFNIIQFNFLLKFQICRLKINKI